MMVTSLRVRVPIAEGVTSGPAQDGGRYRTVAVAPPRRTRVQGTDSYTWAMVTLGPVTGPPHRDPASR